MIEIKNVSFRYKDSEQRNSIKNINLRIKKGEVLVLCGKSGCGKTTITRLINGLIPRYYLGELTGEISINNKSILEKPIYEIANYVGSVFQNPRTQFFNVDSTSEIVFGCENMGWSIDNIESSLRKNISDFFADNLLDRNLFELSGGEKQKIACISVSMYNPEIIVLDEPTSNLDAKSIRVLLNIIKQWKRQGKTVIIAEHRLNYLKDITDRVVFMDSGEISNIYDANKFWSLDTKEFYIHGGKSFISINKELNYTKDKNKYIEIEKFSLSKENKCILDIPNLRIPKGSVVGVLGNNGAGKTTFARILCGLQKTSNGVINFEGKNYNSRKRIKLCYMVMQDVNHQLFTESVEEEVIISLNKRDEKKNSLEEILKGLDLWELRDLHPLSLSGGQKQRVAIAGAVASKKEIIVFDEPTSGLDHYHMLEVVENIKSLKQLGKTQFVITHDQKLLEECCDYFVLIDKGKVVKVGYDMWDKELEKHFSLTI